MTLAHEPDDEHGIPVVVKSRLFTIEVHCAKCGSPKSEANGFGDAECFNCGYHWRCTRLRAQAGKL